MRTKETKAYSQEVLNYAREQIRVYGVNVDNLPDDCDIPNSPEKFIKEAEAQGLVWSLKGFELQANDDTINFNNTLIKII